MHVMVAKSEKEVVRPARHSHRPVPLLYCPVLRRSPRAKYQGASLAINAAQRPSGGTNYNSNSLAGARDYHKDTRIKNMTSYLKAISHTLGRGYGKLNIVLEDGAIRAGKDLKGVIELENEKQIDGEELIITLQGREKSTRKRGPVDVSNQHEFYSFSLPIIDMRGGKIPAGLHSYPFCLTLPSSLSSSAVYRVGVGDVGFAIQYKLSARLGLNTKTVHLAIASAKLERTPSPYIMHPTAQDISAVNGSKQGSITCAATVDNTNIQKGDDIIVALSCRNDSTAKILRVEVKVVEMLNWGANDGFKKSRLFKETLVESVGVQLPGVQKDNENNTELIDATYRTVDAQNAMNASLRDDLVSGLNTIKLKCPLRARDSYSGNLVDIRHYLKIKFVTDYYGSRNQPSIKVPLHVGLPEKIPSLVPVVPEMDTRIPCTPADKKDLPVASPVPISSSLSYDYDQREREPESIPRQKSHFQHKTAVQAGDEGDVELDLSNLVPMLPPSPSFE